MIGAARYFSARYWASRYWPKVGATVEAPAEEPTIGAGGSAGGSPTRDRRPIITGPARPRPARLGPWRTRPPEPSISRPRVRVVAVRGQAVAAHSALPSTRAAIRATASFGPLAVRVTLPMASHGGDAAEWEDLWLLGLVEDFGARIGLPPERMLA